MSDHTPEPWTVREGEWLVWKRGHVIAELMQFGGEDRREANARRIVACVNACAGISNELLEQHPAAISEVYAQSIIATEAELTALRRQVAALVRSLVALDKAAEIVTQGAWLDTPAHADVARVLAATQPQEVQP